MTPTSPLARRRRRLTTLVAVLATALGLTIAGVPAASAADTLLSQGKTATASSQQGADVAAGMAVDGNAGTRWSSQFADPQWIQIDLGATATISQVVLQWENAYATAYQIQTSPDASTWTSIYSTSTGTGGTETRTLTGSGRYVRMYGTARPGGYGYSLWEFKVYGSPATTNPAGCGNTNAAQGKPATASSQEGADVAAAMAVDGNTGTRWSSQFADPQWIQIDLGATQSICQVVLQWENAYATAYQIQTSANASTWTSIYSTTTGTGGTETRTLTGTGRYLRMYGTARASGYGYSLYELKIFTTTSGSTTTPPTTPPTSGPPVETTDPRNPNLGPNTFVFDPSTPTADIQSRLNTIFATQHTNQFGPERYAVLFKPGSYTADVNMGFFTQVAGLGMSPDDVTINGHVRAEADWEGGGNATQNFWRDAENMSVQLPAGTTVERWAVSQAAPYRRMHLKGAGNQIQLWSGGDGWSSGGLLADTKIDGAVISGSQQQWYSRNSEFGSWAGSVWNMVFQGVQGAPPQHFPNPSHTVIATTPQVREKPFLYIDNGEYKVFVPALRSNSTGTSWYNKTPAGTSISLSQFFVARPGTTAATMNAALAQGRHLLITPGVYRLSEALHVTRPDTVVLGLGLASLIPDNGAAAIKVDDVDGVKLAGVLIDAGTTNSTTLVEVGQPGSAAGHAADPTSLHDVFFRIGGIGVGKATNTLVVNSNDVIGDHMWLWRADHGAGWAGPPTRPTRASSSTATT
jgi:F5/8 type C domain